MGETLYVQGVIKPPVRDWSLILIEYSGNHLKHFSIDETELFGKYYQTNTLSFAHNIMHGSCMFRRSEVKGRPLREPKGRNGEIR